MIGDDIIQFVQDFGRTRLAVVERPLPDGRWVVSTQILRNTPPDWTFLIADIRGPIDHLPECS